MFARGSLFAAVLALLAPASMSHSAVVDSFENGWVKSTGEATDRNTNILTGRFNGAEYRSDLEVRPDVLPRHHNCVRQTDIQRWETACTRPPEPSAQGRFSMSKPGLLPGLMKDVQQGSGLRRSGHWRGLRNVYTQSKRAQPYGELG